MFHNTTWHLLLKRNWLQLASLGLDDVVWCVTRSILVCCDQCLQHQRGSWFIVYWEYLMSWILKSVFWKLVCVGYRFLVFCIVWYAKLYLICSGKAVVDCCLERVKFCKCVKWPLWQLLVHLTVYCISKCILCFISAYKSLEMGIGR
jgi:hypothetical protein